jgi:hypothetical protein
VSRRSACWLLWTLLIGACAEPPAARSPLAGHGALYDALTAAADESGVPADILAAAAWSETRLVNRDAVSGGRGLFQLDPEAIAKASALLGVPAEQIARDPRQNARAFAALWARAAGGASDTDAWVEALARTRANPVAGRALVDGTWLALERGFSVERDGDAVVLPPSVLAHQHRDARPDSARARWIASPNYNDASRRPGDVDTVVIHVTQGSYGGTISWFQNPAAEVSAHYVVRSADGEITQMVEEEDIAWHARSWNGRAIGIEHEGFIDDPAWFTDEMYRSSAALTREICQRWNIPMDRDHIKGHVELSGNDHTDPGPHWDWDKYMRLVRGEGDTGRLLGFVREGDIHNEAGNIAGATVAVEGGPAVQSGDDGLYVFEGLPPGPKHVTVTADGFDPVSIDRDVAAGADTWGSVALQRAAPPPPPDAAPPPPDASIVDAALPPDAAPVPDAETRRDPDADVELPGEDAAAAADSAFRPYPGEVSRSARHHGGCQQSPAEAPALAAIGLFLFLRRRSVTRR